VDSDHEIRLIEFGRPEWVLLGDELQTSVSCVACVTNYLVGETTVVRIRTVLRLSVTNGGIRVIKLTA
jgi:hypothetical protein